MDEPDSLRSATKLGQLDISSIRGEAKNLANNLLVAADAEFQQGLGKPTVIRPLMSEETNHQQDAKLLR
jgi:hypothetical protein